MDAPAARAYGPDCPYAKGDGASADRLRRRAELETAGSWARLAAEYDTIAAAAQHDRW